MGVRLYLSDRDAVRVRASLDASGDVPQVVAKLDRHIAPTPPRIAGQTTIDDQLEGMQDAA